LEVIGQELQSVPILEIQVTDPSQRIGIGFRRFDGSEDDSVIRSYLSGLVDRVRVAALEQNIFFRAHDEESRAKCEDKQAGEIDVGEMSGPRQTAPVRLSSKNARGVQ
jgi:hypothetical protein